jgi:hypothetical protein
MKNFSAAAIGLAVTLATPINAASYEDTWVLLGLDIHMGAITTRTFPDLPTPAHGEGLPTFPTKAACERALTRTMAHYAGKSHAEGAFGRYLCTDWRTWATERD